MTHQEKHNNLKNTLKRLSTDRPLLLEKFGSLHKYATSAGALSCKTRELIALGISIAIQCDDCIHYHMHDALAAGATKEEVLDTIEVSVLMGGGPSLMYAAHAYAVLEELHTS